MSNHNLNKDIADLELRLGMRVEASVGKTAKSKEYMSKGLKFLSHGIGEMNKEFVAKGMKYMDLGMDYMDDVEMVEDIDMDYMDDLNDGINDSVVEDAWMDDDMDDVEMVEDIDMDYMYAAEEDVEEEITQDSLSDVVDLEGKGDLADEPSMLETASEEKVAKLKSASQRLDKLANYLEEHGGKKLAFRLDQIADAVDEKIQLTKKQ